MVGPSAVFNLLPGKLKHIGLVSEDMPLHIYIATMHKRLHMQLVLTTKNYPPFSRREIAVYNTVNSRYSLLGIIALTRSASCA
jgi:hypothetical protein